MEHRTSNVQRIQLRRRCRVDRGRCMSVAVHGANLDQIRAVDALPYLGVKALRVLVAAGFVAAQQRSKRECRVCMRSLLQHLRASSSPDFWTSERTARYLEARATHYPRR